MVSAVATRLVLNVAAFLLISPWILTTGSCSLVPPLQSLGLLSSPQDMERSLRRRTTRPTGRPTISERPSSSPGPTAKPTKRPTKSPAPSHKPSGRPSRKPSQKPSRKPSEKPSRKPSEHPSSRPSHRPSVRPSRKPSRSPSSKPSSRPSRSPSRKPSAVPSPRPSRKPSSEPSRKPSRTPSEVPSRKPSREPSRKPSRAPSRKPSGRPSRSPSLVPSITPTSEPSDRPSPLPSTLPSSSPPTLFITSQSYPIRMDLNLVRELTAGAEIESFQEGVVNYILKNNPSTGNVRDVQVSLVSQQLIQGAKGGQRSLSQQKLEINSNVSLTYIGTDTSFNLYKQYGPVFANPPDDLLRSLVDALDKRLQLAGKGGENVFKSLVGTTSSILGSGTQDGGPKGGVSISAKAGVCLVAVVAVAVAIVASAYAIRHHDFEKKQLASLASAKSSAEDTLVHALASDEIQHDDIGFQRISLPESAVERVFQIGEKSFIVDVAVADIPIAPARDQLGSAFAHFQGRETSKHENYEIKVQNEAFQPPNSQRQPEPRYAPDDATGFRIAQLDSSNLWLTQKDPIELQLDKRQAEQSDRQTQGKQSPRLPYWLSQATWLSHALSPPQKQELTNGRQKAVDPPTSSPVELGRAASANDLKSRDGSRTPEQPEFNFFGINHSNSDQSQGRSPYNQVPPSQIGARGGSRVSQSIAERVAQFEKFSDGAINSFFQAQPGTDNDSNNNVGDLSSQAKAIFYSMVERGSNAFRQEASQARQTPLRAVNEPRSIFSREYSVMAPPGPIGLVVDTTKYGPCVHSLKETSPMIGLMTPGDLIVGLDGQDTSGMTAAVLTRLMAQKSGQRERKITLRSAYPD